MFKVWTPSQSAVLEAIIPFARSCRQLWLRQTTVFQQVIILSPKAAADNLKQNCKKPSTDSAHGHCFSPSPLSYLLLPAGYSADAGVVLLLHSGAGGDLCYLLPHYAGDKTLLPPCRANCRCEENCRRHRKLHRRAQILSVCLFGWKKNSWTPVSLGKQEWKSHALNRTTRLVAKGLVLTLRQESRTKRHRCGISSNPPSFIEPVLNPDEQRTRNRVLYLAGLLCRDTRTHTKIEVRPMLSSDLKRLVVLIQFLPTFYYNPLTALNSF